MGPDPTGGRRTEREPDPEMNFLALFACVFFTAIVAVFILGGGELTGQDTPQEAALRALRERKQAIYDNLRDLHFERLAGKLNEEDYQTARHMLEGEAAGVSRELAAAIQK